MSDRFVRERYNSPKFFRFNEWHVMTESHLEQHPLLCNEYSDEEIHIQDTNHRFQRRLRQSIYTGRAKTHAAGAAAIIKRWPDHFSSLLTYWWMGLGMIAVLVFVIYNSIAAIAMLPPTHNKPLKLQRSKYIESKSYENSNAQEIYMHVVVSHYDEFNINIYLPYVEAIAKKYPDFRCNFIIASKDPSQDINDLSDEEKNEMALNLLWTGENIKHKRKQYENCTVTFISLTKYMDNSPLKKYWRLLPYQFIGFLARCIAIWDKGGLAFNPLILPPNTPNSVYLNKLYGILDHQSKNKLISSKKKMSKKSKKKLNNIRDIINNLENEDQEGDYMFPDNLSEAEQIQTVTITSLKAKRNANLFSLDRHNSSENMIKEKDKAVNKNKSNEKDSISRNLNKTTKVINNTQINDVTTTQSLFPKFLEFLFHLKPENSASISQNSVNISTEILTYKNDFLSSNAITKVTPTNDNVSSRKIISNPINKISSENERMKLIIDLKGNLIATNTACHAFIGTVFSNVIHHTDEESLTDFILTELSLFCKGNLPTCNGVEVISL